MHCTQGVYSYSTGTITSVAQMFVQLLITFHSNFEVTRNIGENVRAIDATKIGVSHLRSVCRKSIAVSVSVLH